METSSLRVEYRLDGASNFLSWKERVTLALKEYELWELVKKVVVPPTDPQDLAVHQKKEIKFERVILYSMKDHLIYYLSDKKMAKDMFDALVGLFHSTNINRKMVLRNKLISMHMSISNNITSYFMRITQVRDKPIDIWEKLDDVELVNVPLNGFPKSWEPFFKGFYAREKIPD
jgi:hypothetical protein